jgi:hypothetical protein
MMEIRYPCPSLLKIKVDSEIILFTNFSKGPWAMSENREFGIVYP